MTTKSVPLRGIASVITLERGAKKSLQRQLYEHFRGKALRGEIRAGQMVPSSRELAKQLKISRIPVLNAYAQLLAEGFFESKVGAGTFIASSLPRRSAAEARRAAGNVPSGTRPVSEHAKALPKFQRSWWAEALGPFQVGQPELQNFPIEIWSKLVARHSRRVRARELQYGGPMGLLELREVIATYLRSSRAVNCDAQQIMIVSGSQQALDITTRVLLNAGESAWVEDPGYWLVHHVLTAAGCNAIPVPVDREGLNVSEGIKRRRKPRVVYVTPSHQYPLGVTMSATRRLQLLAWAQQAGAWIVEDDYDSEFRYDSVPVASLQGLDTNARVIYIGTFSKVMFPSMRLGYIVIPPDVVERYAAMRQSMDLCPQGETQAVMADFIREGHFSRHIRRMRLVYAERRRVLVEEVNRQLGDAVKIIGDEAGLHLTLLLHSKFSERRIVSAARERSLFLSGLTTSFPGETARQGFVLGFGNSRIDQIPGAIRTLKTLLQTQ